MDQPLQKQPIINIINNNNISRDNKLSINMTIKELIDEMEKGKESTQILRNILLQRPRLEVNDVDYFQALDHHCMVALTSCVNSLSLIRSCDFNDGKRKMDDIIMDVNDSFGGGFKNEDLCGEVSNYPTNNGKQKRGCYKRRKIGEARKEEVTQLRDDGFGWRKYGQKVIQYAKHPRNYYRCTHKFERNCQASKQVQQISDNPTKFSIIYHGNHTCNHNQSPIIIDDNNEPREVVHPSTIVLNFAQTNPINTFFFPTTTTTTTTTAMKREYNSPRSVQCTSQDQTTSTLVSEQSDLVSTAENCCSNVTQCDVEDDDSSMWTNLEALHSIEFL